MDDNFLGVVRQRFIGNTRTRIYLEDNVFWHFTLFTRDCALCATQFLIYLRNSDRTGSRAHGTSKLHHKSRVRVSTTTLICAHYKAQRERVGSSSFFASHIERIALKRLRHIFIALCVAFK